MRITNQMILARNIKALQLGQRQSAELSQQIVTGRRFQRPSEDPVAARSVLDIDGDLRAFEQYQRNIGAARSRLNAADAAMSSVTELLTRARELGFAQAGDTANGQSRAAAGLEVAELAQEAIALANQQLNGSYVFGGAYADLTPLDSSGDLNPTFPARGAPQYEIGPGVLAVGAQDAGTLFIDSGVMDALEALEVALTTNDKPGIEAATDQVTAAFDEVQRSLAEVGARQVRLDSAQDNLSIVNQGLLERKSTLMDAALDEAAVELATVQSAIQATLATTGRILQTTLTDFIR